jgi:hypothetical protein
VTEIDGDVILDDVEASVRARKRGYRMSPGYLARMRCERRGPDFVKLGGSVGYPCRRFDAYLDARARRFSFA